MTDATNDSTRFEQIVDFEASIESVWAALSDPGELGHWLGSAVDLDVRPGGRGRVVDDDGTSREVLVTDVREHETISWHWWSDRDELSTVELRLDEHHGRTRLHIIESVVPSTTAAATTSDPIERCARRWSAATSRLWCRVSTATFA